MYILYDTLSSDFSSSWNAPHHTLTREPRLIRLCWMICESGGQIIDRQDVWIRQLDYRLPQTLQLLYGLSDVYLQESGVPIGVATKGLREWVQRGAETVAMGEERHRRIIGAEARKQRAFHPLQGAIPNCLERMATIFLGQKNRDGSAKPPSLSQLNQVLFGQPVSSGEDPLEVMRRCFFALKEKGIYGPVQSRS